MNLRKITATAAVIGVAFMGFTVPASASPYTPAPASMDSVLRGTYLLQQDIANDENGAIPAAQITRDVEGWYKDVDAFGGPFGNTAANFAAFIKAEPKDVLIANANTWLLGLIGQEIHYIETGNT